jgi:hypothetical protein
MARTVVEYRYVSSTSYSRRASELLLQEGDHIDLGGHRAHHDRRILCEVTMSVEPVIIFFIVFAGPPMVFGGVLVWLSVREEL